MLIFISVLVMFLDVRTPFDFAVRPWLNSTVYPIQYLVNLPGEIFYKTLSSITSQRQLLKENRTLKTKNILLKLRDQRFLDLENENKQLRSLLAASEILPVRVSVAEVFFVSANQRASEWIINQGEDKGTYLGQPVLDADGVLGQIIQVGQQTSRVMLLSDPRSSIPVESVSTGLHGLVQGDGGGRPLSLGFIPKTEKVTVGDRLISSGVGERFPKGYPVGTIASVEDSPGEPFLTINVTPAAELEHQHFVLLLWIDHA